MSRPLSTGEIIDALQILPGWRGNESEIRVIYKFIDFATAMQMVNGIADIANQLNHHPDFSCSYNRVTISTSTHDAGNIITDLDITFAQRVSVLAIRLGAK